MHSIFINHLKPILRQPLLPAKALLSLQLIVSLQQLLSILPLLSIQPLLQQIIRQPQKKILHQLPRPLLSILLPQRHGQNGVFVPKHVDQVPGFEPVVKKNKRRHVTLNPVVSAVIAF